MNSNFGKTEKGNGMENDTEIDPKTRYSTFLSKPGEVDQPRSGRGVIKPSRYGQKQTVKRLIVKGGCYV